MKKRAHRNTGAIEGQRKLKPMDGGESSVWHLSCAPQNIPSPSHWKPVRPTLNTNRPTEVPPDTEDAFLENRSPTAVPL
ncbi:hypothetical protein TREES_T100014199 [Tupaia chinensis]|uniref:Uncharacterized protein n=1 Tax=Tupaia chinensis TaxID=246437 RepID=L9KMK4_TUPCH|nr:hypothetical protein TREES_T100014199 [Tupaia chinensis]